MKPLLLALLAISSVHGKLMPTSAEVFGEKYSRLDDRATSDWWKRQDANKKRAMINPHSPPSAPVQRRLQGTPAKSKFLAVSRRLFDPDGIHQMFEDQEEHRSIEVDWDET